MARRLMLALFAALLVSGICTYFLGKNILGKNKQGQRYVAAGRSLEFGEVLKPATLTMVDWPAGIPLSGSFDKPQSLNGRIVLYPLAAGEPILERHLAAAGSSAGLSARIPEGMRAISLKSDEVVGVAGFLLPGTHVDVLETDRDNNTAASRSNTSTVLQDVEVLAAGQKIEPDPEGKATSVNVVTLLLKPEDAEKIVLASSVGTIHFVLRNGGDRTRVAESAPVKPVVLHTPFKPRPRAIAATSTTYIVETQMGDKKFISSFN